MVTEFEIPSYRAGAWMLLVEIISNLYGHITIDHETVALVCNSQVKQSILKSILQRSFSRGIKFQILERLCHIPYCRISVLVFQDFEGCGQNGILHHDQVSDANILMKIAFLN